MPKILGRQFIALGFSVFLEHILHYDRKEEKGIMKISPLVQLGGGAFNIAKSFQTLGVPSKKISLVSFLGKANDPDTRAVEYLLKQEKFFYKTFFLREKTPSSYYLIPSRGKTWAFGYRGGKVVLNRSVHKALKHHAEKARLKILAEISGEAAEGDLAALFLKKYHPGQISGLVASVDFLRSRKGKNIIPQLDFLALNETEAKLFFNRKPQVGDLLKFPIPYIFITRGPREAWFKAKHSVLRVFPRKVKNPPFIGGAGDAAAAALIFKFFYKKEPPDASLRFAMKIGRETLLMPTSYYGSRG
ncbi:hypothetical protein A2757_01470 [Candidatus Giovannonibacteria bacterium RIFCSPHIGHO2_01_FULL_48_47]|nr:MAG: hypothetical protein A2757_01470 [Candidatus Giovannonibacteria bacterium RIFCSPHIGHO2_01_FULL_48_47]OGF68395.1 MAG: hypothetical protein A3D61_00760 [Candidatus Giovannonibacteria bacterium RIFCSPHIGHO2_02_FULL_48_15]OGF89698.1 MAG: hypothetical protein A3B26_01595 [Candidatus Giovannonibacteria bacterium RIFCSPLOWO2_01_FULL_48_47]OGF95010.1 MAG: hypothetical protein A2433_02995 [Candidatus Giovannonibacteria bacterium RIFOXYC1_FULL_48_8]OGF96150.1 MAG: hypothetical protein A2613_01095